MGFFLVGFFGLFLMSSSSSKGAWPAGTGVLCWPLPTAVPEDRASWACVGWKTAEIAVPPALRQEFKRIYPNILPVLCWLWEKMVCGQWFAAELWPSEQPSVGEAEMKF